MNSSSQLSPGRTFPDTLIAQDKKEMSFTEELQYDHQNKKDGKDEEEEDKVNEVKQGEQSAGERRRNAIEEREEEDKQEGAEKRGDELKDEEESENQEKSDEDGGRGEEDDEDGRRGDDEDGVRGEEEGDDQDGRRGEGKEKDERVVGNVDREKWFQETLGDKGDEETVNNKLQHSHLGYLDPHSGILPPLPSHDELGPYADDAIAANNFIIIILYIAFHFNLFSN